jgi:hypothetical protein
MRTLWLAAAAIATAPHAFAAAPPAKDWWEVHLGVYASCFTHDCGTWRPYPAPRCERASESPAKTLETANQYRPSARIIDHGDEVDVTSRKDDTVGGLTDPSHLNPFRYFRTGWDQLAGRSCG